MTTSTDNVALGANVANEKLVVFRGGTEPTGSTYDVARFVSSDHPVTRWVDSGGSEYGAIGPDADKFIFGASEDFAWRTGLTSNGELYNSGSEKMRLDQNGDLGIGDTSPSTKLSLGGSGYANGITFGDDAADPANLYRSAANTLTTDDLVTGNDSSTGTSQTTTNSGTHGTLITVADSSGFVAGDVIFIDNTGQDYYARVASVPLGTWIIADQEVSWDSGATVTKRNSQSLGGNPASYTDNAKFFDGSFGGRVVVGAGTDPTTLTVLGNNRLDFGSDTNLYRDTANNLRTSDTFSAAGYKTGTTAGTSVSCSSGQVLLQPVVSGGIVTSGSCGANGSGSSPWTTTGNDLYYDTGNVGIGTGGAPTGKFDVNNSSFGQMDIHFRTSASSSADTAVHIKGARTSCSTCDIAQIQLEDNADGDLAHITARKQTSNTNEGNLLFWTTTTDGGSPTEKARLDRDGNFTVTGGGVNPGTFNRTSNDGTIVSLRQDGTEEGTISVSGTTVSYNAFTGSHYADAQENIDRAMLVTQTGKNRHLGDRKDSELLYGVKRSTKENDPAVMGAYLSVLNPKTRENKDRSESVTNPSLVMAVGNGEVWVADTGEDLKPGDSLISSEVAGHAIKDPGTHDVSHVVAKVAEPVAWDEVKETVDADGEKVKHRKVSVFFTAFDKVNRSAGEEELQAVEAKVDDLRTDAIAADKERDKRNDTRFGDLEEDVAKLQAAAAQLRGAEAVADVPSGEEDEESPDFRSSIVGELDRIDPDTEQLKRQVEQLRADLDKRDKSILAVVSDLTVHGNLTLNDSIRGIDVAIRKGEKKLRINFERPQKDDRYSIQVEPSWLTLTAVTAKDSDGFTVEFDKVAPDEAAIDWLLVR